MQNHRITNGGDSVQLADLVKKIHLTLENTKLCGLVKERVVADFYHLMEWEFHFQEES